MDNEFDYNSRLNNQINHNDQSINNNDTIDNIHTNSKNRINNRIISIFKIIYNRLSFSWLNPIIIIGLNNILQFSDLYGLKQQFKPEISLKLLDINIDKSLILFNQQQNNRQLPSKLLLECSFSEYSKLLFYSIIKTFKYELIISTILQLISNSLLLIQPTILEYFIINVGIYGNSVNNNNNNNNKTNALINGILLCITLFITSIIYALVTAMNRQLCIRIANQLQSVLLLKIYIKMFRLSYVKSTKSGSQFNIEKLIQCSIIDAVKINNLLMQWTIGWSSILQVIIVLILLIINLKLSVLPCIPVWLILILTQRYYRILILQAECSIIRYRQLRIRLVNELLHGIRVVKIYSWEKFFEKSIITVKLKETILIKRKLKLDSNRRAITFSAPLIMALSTFALLTTKYSDQFKASTVFSTLALFNLLRNPMHELPIYSTIYQDAKIAFNRIVQLLIAPEIQKVQQISLNDKIIDNSDYVIKIDSASFSWEINENKIEIQKLLNNDNESFKSVNFILRNINLNIPRNSLICIVGSVGSGKSSFLQSLFGEMQLINGSFKVSGTFSYCAQQSWIQNMSIRDNILFGEKFNLDRYNRVIDVCALQRDFQLLDEGDLTDIGDRGVNLSGGQKARIALGRAIYANKDIILLDDPLSAVDSNVSNHLFYKAILNYSNNKTRLLVTHQLQYTPHCDYLIVMRQGEIIEKGSYKELINLNGYFSNLIEGFLGMDNNNNNSNNKVDNIINNDIIVQDDNNISNNSKLTNVTPIQSTNIVTKVSEITSFIKPENRLNGEISMEIYRFYWRAMGGITLISLTILTLIIGLCTKLIIDIWLSWWTDNKFELNNNQYIIGYALLSISQITWVSIISTFLLIQLCSKAASLIHTQLIIKLLNSPLGYFESNFIGRILTIFTQDQSIIEFEIYESLRFLLYYSLFFGTTLIFICILRPEVLIAIIPSIPCYIYIRNQIRCSNREIKRLIAIAKTTITQHLSSSLSGLLSIRSGNYNDKFINYYIKLLNRYQSTSVIGFNLVNWLYIRSELITAFLLFTIGLSCILQSNSESQSGLLLSNGMQLACAIVWSIQANIRLETASTAVERNAQLYTEAEQEISIINNDINSPILNKLELVDKWPNVGKIEFDSVELSYRIGLPPILNSVNFTIEGGQKIGIVGRTGAGKSTLLTSILRLVELNSGKILIDNIDITQINLHQLRSSIAVIPQDAILYSGTIRSNLDPFNQYSDSELLISLDKACIKDFIENLPKSLFSPVGVHGDNFSSGQRCQICLARSLLKISPILIMDEPTASIDLELDLMIQRSIKRNCRGSILTIAHRLHTICDYDKILVLDSGRVIEFDSPAKLLRNSESTFSSMVDELGSKSASLLRRIAFSAEVSEFLSESELLNLLLAATSKTVQIEKRPIFELTSMEIQVIRLISIVLNIEFDSISVNSSFKILNGGITLDQYMAILRLIHYELELTDISLDQLVKFNSIRSLCATLSIEELNKEQIQLELSKEDSINNDNSIIDYLDTDNPNEIPIELIKSNNSNKSTIEYRLLFTIMQLIGIIFYCFQLVFIIILALNITLLITIYIQLKLNKAEFIQRWLLYSINIYLTISITIIILVIVFIIESRLLTINLPSKSSINSLTHYRFWLALTFWNYLKLILFPLEGTIFINIFYYLCGAKIGFNSYIYTLSIDLPSMYIIGNNVFISTNVRLKGYSFIKYIDQQHNNNNNNNKYKYKIIFSPLVIEDNVFIGERSIIHSGSHIGSRCIIQPLSRVSNILNSGIELCGNSIINSNQKLNINQLGLRLSIKSRIFQSLFTINLLIIILLLNSLLIGLMICILLNYFSSSISLFILFQPICWMFWSLIEGFVCMIIYRLIVFNNNNTVIISFRLDSMNNWYYIWCNEFLLKLIKIYFSFLPSDISMKLIFICLGVQFKSNNNYLSIWDIMKDKTISISNQIGIHLPLNLLTIETGVIIDSNSSIGSLRIGLDRLIIIKSIKLSKGIYIGSHSIIESNLNQLINVAPLTLIKPNQGELIDSNSLVIGINSAPLPNIPINQLKSIIDKDSSIEFSNYSFLLLMLISELFITFLTFIPLIIINEFGLLYSEFENKFEFLNQLILIIYITIIILLTFINLSLVIILFHRIIIDEEIIDSVDYYTESNQSLLSYNNVRSRLKNILFSYFYNIWSILIGTSLNQSILLNSFYRLLGSKINQNVIICDSNSISFHFNLITIGYESIIESDVRFYPVNSIGKSNFKFRPGLKIIIGNQNYIDNYCILYGGSHLLKLIHLNSITLIDHTQSPLPSNSIWQGNISTRQILKKFNSKNKRSVITDNNNNNSSISILPNNRRQSVSRINFNSISDIEQKSKIQSIETDNYNVLNSINEISN